MVLSGMIGTREASDLRKKVMDRKDNIHNVFRDIQQKTDMELLSELHQFSEKTMRYANLQLKVMPRRRQLTWLLLYFVLPGPCNKSH